MLYTNLAFYTVRLFFFENQNYNFQQVLVFFRSILPHNSSYSLLALFSKTYIIHHHSKNRYETACTSTSTHVRLHLLGFPQVTLLVNLHKYASMIYSENCCCYVSFQSRRATKLFTFLHTKPAGNQFSRGYLGTDSTTTPAARRQAFSGTN